MAKLKSLLLLLAVLVCLISPSSSRSWKSKEEKIEKKKRKGAVVTLVSGSNSAGYASGALALGQSLVDVGSELDRVVMITKG